MDSEPGCSIMPDMATPRTGRNRFVHLALACALLIGLWGGADSSWAQGATGAQPLFVPLDEARTRFLRFGVGVQIWGRYTALNPGSLLSEDGAVRSEVYDVSIRRFRVSLDAQLDPRAMGYIQIGLNNLNFQAGGGTSVDLLDAYAEYHASPAFQVGGGKSAWNGLSRYSSPSTSRMLTLDLPLVALPTLNITDDLLRNLGIWVKGRASRLDYRLIGFRPFALEGGRAGDPPLEENVAKFTEDGLAVAYGASVYVKWQFFEFENNRLPFMPGTYLGTKKVLNLGAGFEFQRDRTIHLENGEPVFNDLQLRAIDLFLDLPLGPERRNAVTAYAAFFDYRFGPNAIRNIGANNPTVGVDRDEASFNGRGNAYPLVGTGSTFYVQAGYLFAPLGRGGKAGRLQPFADLQVSDFERLDERMVAWNVGVNWLLAGHNSKFTLGLQRRPIFYDENEGITAGDHKSMVVLQYQFRLS